ncbi:coagulation factor X-like [Atheta coriaria]|uniref:coagulation factor X-like n=1 Tax=Dalotia coriaria TaxID=877792 RepID=UPI0031F3C977
MNTSASMFIFWCIIAFITRVLGDINCGGLLTLKKGSCSPQIVLTIPSDGSGVYNFVLNTSLPIYSHENIDVELENKEAVQRGTASYLVYVASHPSCVDGLRVTRMVFNNRVLCENEPYKVSTKQAVTKFSYESTHYGEKNKITHNSLGQVQSPPQKQRPFELNLWNSLQPPSNIGSALTQIPGYKGQGLPQGQTEAFPNNPFLSSLNSPPSSTSLPSSQTNNQIKNPFTDHITLDNRGVFNNNPFLNGQLSFTTPTSSVITPEPTPVNIDTICGLSTYALVQGGSDVQPGEFPWLGGLFTRATNKYLCTVNLVSQRHAITAAHCFESPDEAHIYGVLWGHPKSRRGNKSYAPLRAVQIHPSYNQSAKHDVAIMTLADSVIFSLQLKPICLWKVGRAGGLRVTGMVAGFGPDYTDLKKIEFPIVSQETCLASNVIFHFVTSEFTFCAGTQKSEEGPCKGDSGAGYMQWVDDRYFLRGLVSHSLNANGNCNLREYIIFADLSKEIAWIRQAIS